MTDTEIIQALECCTTEGVKCSDCPAFKKVDQSDCKNYFRGVIDLINRLQAENERLKYQVNRLKNYDERRDIDLHSRLIANARAEAIKEFAEKSIEQVEKTRQKYQRLCKEQGEEVEEAMHIHFNGMVKIINNVKKEMRVENDL